MTICALLLGRQFYDLQPSTRLKYATLGLLFVNVSIGGTLTHFAAPPVLMVARPWGWDTPFMLDALRLARDPRHRRRRRRSTSSSSAASSRRSPPCRPSPDVDAARRARASGRAAAGARWVTAVHLAFMAWTVFTAHYPALFIGGFLFFLGFATATAPYQSRIELKTPLLVGFFLGGPRDPRRPAGLVDRAGARPACRRSRCSSARRS